MMEVLLAIAVILIIIVLGLFLLVARLMERVKKLEHLVAALVRQEAMRKEAEK